MVDNNQDPLGTFTADSGPENTPLKGLIWPVGTTAATMNPTDHPDINNSGGDNWIQLSDYGTEPTVSGGDYICIAVHYTGSGGDGSNSNISFLYNEYSGFESWPSLKFYNNQ